MNWTLVIIYYTVIGLFFARSCVASPRGRSMPANQIPTLFIFSVLFWLPATVAVAFEVLIEYFRAEPLDPSDDPSYPEDTAELLTPNS